MASGKHNFCPGGFEDDDDDFDGFDFGGSDSISSESKAIPSSDAVNMNGTPCQFQYNSGNIEEECTTSKNRRNAQNAPPIINGSIAVDDLRQAVLNGNIDLVQRFLEKGADVDLVMRSGWTPLMYASNSANVSLVNLLLKWGADVNFQKDQYNSLMAACSSTKRDETAVLQCVSKLIAADIDVNSYDRYHLTPLMYAAKEGHINVVEKLLEYNTEIDRQDCNGITALIWATYRQQCGVVSLLLSHSADPNKKCGNGDTALDIAITRGYDKITGVLRLANGLQVKEKSSVLNTEVSSTLNSSSLDVPVTQNVGQSDIESFGDLEIFLYGLDLSDLIPIFRTHQVMFPAFMRMSDYDLQQVGVHRLGQRKKILEAIHDVHKKEWQQSSLNRIQYNKQINYACASAMVKNIAKHIDYISSSIGYLKDQIKANPETLKHGQGGDSMSSILIYTKESIYNVQALHVELGQLTDHLCAISELQEFKPADLIPHKPSLKKQSRYRFITTSFSTLTIVGSVLYMFLKWKKIQLFNNF